MSDKKKSGKNAPDPYVARLREIVSIMESSSLYALEYEDEDIDVRLYRGPIGLDDFVDEDDDDFDQADLYVEGGKDADA